MTQLFGRIGVVRYYSDLAPSMDATLASAPQGIAPFAAADTIDRRFPELALGANLLRTEGIDLRLEYAAQIGEHSREQTAQLKLTLPVGAAKE